MWLAGYKRILLFLLLPVFLLRACSLANPSSTPAITNSNEKEREKVAQVKLIETYWQGDPYVANPEEKERMLELRVGDALDLGGVSNLVITVAKVEKNSVILETNVPMSDEEGDSIDMKSTKTSFTLEPSNTLKLTTLSYDYGDVYIFEFLELKDGTNASHSSDE